MSREVDLFKPTDSLTSEVNVNYLAMALAEYPNPHHMQLKLCDFRLTNDHTSRLFTIWCAIHTPLKDGRIAWDLLTDPRSRRAVRVAERYAHSQATGTELASACSEAHLANTAIAIATTSEEVRNAAYNAWMATWPHLYGPALTSTWPVAQRAQANALRQLYDN